VLVTYDAIPPFIGWLGIVASISIGFSNGIELVKPNFKTKTNFKILLVISGLSAILFEVLIGLRLLFI